MLTQIKAKARHHGAIIILVIIFLLLATVFNLTLPLGESADELDHFTLIRFIAEKGKIPMTLQERVMWGHKGDASPVYHSLVALLSQHNDITPLPALPEQQIPERFIPFDFVRSYTLFHTEDEFFPFRGIVLSWHFARGVSALLGAVTVLAVYLTGLALYPKRRYLALAMACFVAFIPRFVINSASINDDNLVVALTSLIIYGLIRIVKGSRRKVDFILVGALTGLAVIAKYHPIVLLFETTLLLGFLAWQEGWNRRFLLENWGWMIAGFSVLVIPWFIFLFSRFNQIDTLGLVAGLLAPLGDSDVTSAVNGTGIADPVTWLGWIKPLFRTFWMEYGGVKVFAPALVYQLLIFPLGISVLGLAQIGYEYLRSNQKNLRHFPAGIVLLVINGLIYLGIVLVRYQMVGPTRGAQGRHLYAALGSIAFFFAMGTSGLISGLLHRTGSEQARYALSDKLTALATAMGLFSFSVVSLFYFILPVYRPDYLPITTLPPAEVAIGNRIEHSFTKAVKFVGYTVKNADDPAADVVSLDLYWQAQKKTAQDYVARLCLQDNQGKVVSCHWSHPADGKYPTRAWEKPYLVRDEVNLPLPACLPAGAYTLVLSLWPLRSDVPYAVVDAASAEAPISLGEIVRQKNGTTGNGQTVCTQNGCSPTGTAVLTQIRQSLTLIIYSPGNNPQTGAYFSSAQNPEKWEPISPPAGYVCPNGQAARTYSFILGAKVKPGIYDLVTAQAGPEKSRVNVQTRSRYFELSSKPQTGLDIVFNEEFELLGYDLNLMPRRPGDIIDVYTYWRALKTMNSHYVISLHLLDNSMMMASQSDQLLGQYYSNVLWSPGEVVTDSHRLLLGTQTPPGLYTVELNIYDGVLNTFKPLPMVSAEMARPIDRNPILGQIRILDAMQEKFPDHPVSVRLGHGIRLAGYDLDAGDPPSPLSLALYWQADDVPAKDYTVFTQLLGPDGQVWAQQDNRPQAGRYPTSVWQTGDKIVDRYELALRENPPAGKYRLLVGMYDWTTGERLEARGEDGINLPDNAVVLTEIELN